MLRRLIMMSLLALAPVALSLACQTSVIDARDRPAPAPAPFPTIASPLSAPCLADGNTCDKEGTLCCGAAFCADTGYGHGTCTPPRPNGGYCADGAQCQSGLCHAYTCVAELPACVTLGAYCADGAPCCTGYCLPPSYDPASGTCVPLRPEGSSCFEPGQCESGRCELDVCRAADCSATGAECSSDAACCGGFCTGGSYSYGPGACTMPQPAGAHCETWMWCASMSCVASVCAP